MSTSSSDISTPTHVLDVINPNPIIVLYDTPSSNIELSIHNLPPFHALPQSTSLRDPLTLWRIAIEYYNHGRFNDFDQLCNLFPMDQPILQVVVCSARLANLFSSEQSSQHHKSYDEILSHITTLLELHSHKNNSDDNNNNTSHNNNINNPHNNSTNTSNHSIFDDSTAYDNFDKSYSQLYIPLSTIILSLLQFVRVTQSATLEFADTTKVKDKLSQTFTNAINTPGMTLRMVSQTSDTTGNNNVLLQVPSARQEMLSIIKSTLLTVSTQHSEMTPLCYIILGTIAIYEAQYTIATRFLCLALAKNPLLPPTVRLALGYCHYYKQQYHEAKMSFVRALNICVNDKSAPKQRDEILYNHCAIDSILGLTITEVAILQLEIKNANTLIDEYEKQLFLGQITEEQSQQCIVQQQEQFELIGKHVQRVFNTLNNIIQLHATTQIQHPILTLYVVQIELARRVCSIHLQAANGGVDTQQHLNQMKRSLSVYLRFFQWDPDGTYLHQHLTMLSSTNSNFDGSSSNFIQPSCNVDDLIIILQTLTRHNIPSNNGIINPSNENTLYPTTLNPMVLIQGLLYLAHCYFISHRFDAADECYSLAFNKLNATISTSTLSTPSTQQLQQQQGATQTSSLSTAMAAAGVSQQHDQNFLHLDAVNTLRTICLLQTAKCLFICDKLTHACTAINRAISSLPQSCSILQPSQSMYVNLEQYIYYQYTVRSKHHKFFGLGVDQQQSLHPATKYAGIGGPDGKTVKGYNDLELAINMTYVQIMVAYYNTRKRPYTTTIQSKYSSDENGLTNAMNQKKREKAFVQSVPIPQSMPLLSILAATCLYHHEQRLLIEQDDKPTQYTHVDETFHYLLVLSINAAVTDLAVVQDVNIMLFGLFAVLRLLNIDFAPLYQLLYPQEDCINNIYHQTQLNSTSIVSILQQIQIEVFKIIVGVNNNNTTTTNDSISSTIQQSLSPLSSTFKYFSVSTWSNITTLCTILCTHYQQFNTRLFTLQQSQLTEYIHRNKSQIHFNQQQFSQQQQSTMMGDDDTTNTTQSLQSLCPQQSQTISNVMNPFVPMLLQHFPSSLHHILLGSPVSLLPTTPSTTMDSQSKSINPASMIATIPLATNHKDKFPFLQHASYLGLTTSIQHQQQNAQHKSHSYDWVDISLPTATLFKDNIFALILTITMSITLAMSSLEAGPAYRTLIEQQLSASPTIISFTNSNKSNLDQDQLSRILHSHQVIDTNDGSVVSHPNKQVSFANIYGILVPLPLPLHSIPIIESFILPMRTFFLSYPYDKYSPNNMQVPTSPNHFNHHFFFTFSYSLQYVRNTNFMSLLESSSLSLSSPTNTTNENQPLYENQTPQQYHFKNYFQHIINAMSFAFTLSGLALSSHGMHLPLRLARIDCFLQLHDLFTTIESIRQKVHFSTTIATKSLQSYETHIKSSNKVPFDSLSTSQNLDTLLSQHHYFITPHQLNQYQELSTNKKGFLFEYIDWEFDYLGFSVYFGHSAVSILKLLQDLIPERPLIIPLQSLPLNYYQDLLSSDTLSKITALRYRHQAQAFEQRLLTLQSLPCGLHLIDQSGFDDLATILTTHSMQSYLDLTRSNGEFTSSTQFQQMQSTQHIPGGATMNDNHGHPKMQTIVTNSYTGHIHPFYYRRFQKQKRLGNPIVLNSDCIIIGRNVPSQIDTLIQETNFANTLEQQLQLRFLTYPNQTIFIPRALSTQYKLYPRSLYIQLHFTHPYLICSDGSLYSSIVPHLFPNVSHSQLSYISNNWNWYNNQNGLSISPPYGDSISKQSGGGSGEMIEPIIIFPYMYTHFYIHHQTIHQSAVSRSDSAIKTILQQFATTNTVSNTQHTSSSLRTFLLTLQLIHKYKRSEKERLKLVRLRESIHQKEILLNTLNIQLQQAEHGNGTTQTDVLRSNRSIQQKRVAEFKLDCAKAATELKTILFDIIGTCNTFLLGPQQQDAIDFIQSSISKDKKDSKTSTAVPIPSLSSSTVATKKDKSTQIGASDDYAGSNVLLLLITILASINLLREHTTSTPVKDGDQQRLKILNVQHNLRQLKTLLIKSCLSNTSTYQFVTASTMYHNMAPLSLVFTPGRLNIPMTANISTNTPPNQYNLQSITGQSNSLPPSIAIVLTIFHSIASINEQLNNYDDALFYAYTAAVLSGYHKTLSLSQHPLWFISNAAQIYHNDHRSESALSNIHTNIHNVIQSTQQQFTPTRLRTTQLTTSLITSYPTQTFLSQYNQSSFSYNYLPSLLDCDLIYITQLAQIMKKQLLLPISLLGNARHELLLQIITQHGLNSFINYQQSYRFQVKSTTHSTTHTASIFPYGKFDSVGFSTYLQNATPPNSTLGLLSYSLQGITQCSVDHTNLSYNLAACLQQFAITMFRHYNQAIGLAASSTSPSTSKPSQHTQEKANLTNLYFNLASLLQFQQPECHGIGLVTIELTDPIVSQLLMSNAPFNKIDPTYFTDTSLEPLVNQIHSQQRGSNTQLFRGLANIGPFDSSSICFVANFAASGLFVQLRTLLASLLPQSPGQIQPHLGILHYLPPSLNLPLLYQTFSTSAVTFGSAPYRNLSTIARCETGLESTTILFNTIRVNIQLEQEKQIREQQARVALTERAKEVQTRSELENEQRTKIDHQKKIDEQERARLAQQSVVDFLAEHKERLMTNGVDGETRAIDQLTLKKTKKSGSRYSMVSNNIDNNNPDEESSSSSRRSSKKSKKDKKDKKDKKSRKSRRTHTPTNDTLDAGDDLDDFENRVITFGANDDDEDDQDNNDSDDDHNTADSTLDTDAGIEMNMRKTRFDDDSDDDELGPINKKSRHPTAGTLPTEQVQVSLGNPSIPSNESSTPSIAHIDDDNSVAPKRRLIFDSDDE